jgi:hypothetical protein
MGPSIKKEKIGLDLDSMGRVRTEINGSLLSVNTLPTRGKN